MADGLPAQQPRLGDRRQPRPDPSGRVDHPRAPPRRRQDARVPRHVLAVPEGAEARGEAADVAGAEAGIGDQAVERARRGDAAPDREASSDREIDLQASRSAEGPAGVGAQARAQGQGHVSGPAAQRARRDDRERPGQGLRRPDRVSRREVRGRARAAARGHGPERRRQDEPAAHPRRPDASRTPAASGWATACRSATTRRSTRASAQGVPVLAHMREQSDADERVLRALLGTFSLTGDIARQDAGTLSGGEKTKLALAQLVAGKHNLLLLDEPTNNLDPPSRTGVALALAAWPGTMVIVSHDPEFVRGAAAAARALHARRPRRLLGRRSARRRLPGVGEYGWKKDVEDWEEGVGAGLGWHSRLGCEVPSPAQRERVRVRAAKAVISPVFLVLTY